MPRHASTAAANTLIIRLLLTAILNPGDRVHDKVRESDSYERNAERPRDRVSDEAAQSSSTR